MVGRRCKNFGVYHREALNYLTEQLIEIDRAGIWRDENLGRHKEPSKDWKEVLPLQRGREFGPELGNPSVLVPLVLRESEEKRD